MMALTWEGTYIPPHSQAVTGIDNANTARSAVRPLVESITPQIQGIFTEVNKFTSHKNSSLIFVFDTGERPYGDASWRVIVAM